MSSGKRTFSRLAGGIGLFLILLACLLLLLPLLASREWSRERIAGKVSALVGGNVEIQAAELHYWPRPHVEIRGATFDIPGKAAGTIRSLTAYPRIVLLFLGEVRVSALRFDSADISVSIPDKMVGAPEKEEVVPAPASPEEKLRSVLDSMARSVPDLKLVLANVRVDISGRDHPPLSFRDIEGSVVLPPAGPDIDLSCTGTLWERASVKGRFEGHGLAGKGRIILNGFRPHLLAGSLFPGTDVGISDSEIDLDLRVEADGWAKLHAEGDVSIPRMTLHRRNRSLELAGGTVRGTLSRDGEETTLALTELSLESPRLMLSGSLFLDGEARRSRAEVQARQVDISSVRDHALALARDVPVVGEIFSIVQAGTIPSLAFRAEGETADDLWQFANMEFTGVLQDGKIIVDAGKTDLAIDRVRGNVALSRGYLTASNLAGDLGKIKAHDGTLRMGFLGPDTPFHLEASVAAGAAELPPLLNVLIASDPLREEMSRVESLGGTVSGRLVLGETLEALRVAVEVDAMDLSAIYRRLPHPLTVSGGRFLYRGNEISVSGARGAMGKSAFSGLSGKVRWTESPSLEIRSGKFRLSLDELNPWARATEGLRESLAKIRHLGGTVAFSINRLEGPVFAPRDWHFDVSGNVERLSFSIPSVPGTIDVVEGTFRTTPETLVFEGLRVKFLDASVSTSGSLEGYRTDGGRNAATVSGRLGGEAIGFLHDLAKIPPGFLVRPPLELSGVRLEWQKGALGALKGNFTSGNGPKISVDFFRPPGEWVVRNLSVEDKDSNASLSLHRKPGSLDLAFEGYLHHETVNRIVDSGSPPGGWLKGDFRASLQFDEPVRSTARGFLEGRDIRFLQRLTTPVIVDDLILSAEGSRVAVPKAKIMIGDSFVLLKGEATASQEGLTIDMDASTPGLDGEDVREAFGSPGAEEGLPGTGGGNGERAWEVPVRGTVRLRSGYFRYGRHTVEPATAEIVFGTTGVTLTITEAGYCGIPFNGTIRAGSGETTFEFLPNARDRDVESVYDCLSDDSGRMTGRFDLFGKIDGRFREGEDPVRSLRGNLEYVARNGRIVGTPIFTRIFSLLNLTDIFRGKIPDLVKEGLEYVSYSIRGDLRNADFTITEFVLDGKTIDVVGEGRINVETQECDLVMLVAPFTTMNYVIGKIPLLGRILGGKLVEVPVKVSGPVTGPEVSLLEPAAVGKNLLGIIERTFLLPVELIRPLLPGEKEEDR